VCDREMLVMLFTHQCVGSGKKLLQMTNVKVVISAMKLKEEIDKLALVYICQC
jgi:hypothetical protein